MNEIVEIIKDVGFPIAISLYLLITQNSTIKKNTEALGDLKDLIRNMYMEK